MDYQQRLFKRMQDQLQDLIGSVVCVWLSLTLTASLKPTNLSPNVIELTFPQRSGSRRLAAAARNSWQREKRSFKRPLKSHLLHRTDDRDYNSHQ